MTQAADAPPLIVGDAAAAVSALRERGLRISTVRRLVIEALFDSGVPVSAATLAQQLELDESSVYRNLEVLEREGLVRHLHLGHGPGLYLAAGEREHEYLYCERCGKVTVAGPGELDAIHAEIDERFGYTARFTHFAIVGICPECRALAE